MHLRTEDIQKSLYVDEDYARINKIGMWSNRASIILILQQS